MRSSWRAFLAMSLVAVFSGLGSAPVASATDLSDSSPVAGWSVHAALKTLPVKGRAPKTGYERAKFGSAWSDVDKNGCDTRNDILKRDLRGITYKTIGNYCVVQTGILADPYTATRIDFMRGQSTSQAVQIDHVVALSDAWQKGAQQLTYEERRAFANDPYNLFAVQGKANMQKKDGDIATWEPSNKAFVCEYAARQVGVKAKYHLWVTQAERNRFQALFDTCPAQKVPLVDGISQTQKKYLEKKLGLEAQPQPAPTTQTPTLKPSPTMSVPQPSTPSPSGSVLETVTMLRLYNKATGEHFYTSDVYEKNALVKKHGWTYEGVAWIAPKKSSAPVYRLYNKVSGDHHYTMSFVEMNVLVSRHGWTYEGVGWYSDTSERVKVYRAYNPRLRVGSHHYTTDVNEYRALYTKHGWRAENTAWYAVRIK